MQTKKHARPRPKQAAEGRRSARAHSQGRPPSAADTVAPDRGPLPQHPAGHRSPRGRHRHPPRAEGAVRAERAGTCGRPVRPSPPADHARRAPAVPAEGGRAQPAARPPTPPRSPRRLPPRQARDGAEGRRAQGGRRPTGGPAVPPPSAAPPPFPPQLATTATAAVPRAAPPATDRMGQSGSRSRGARRSHHPSCRRRGAAPVGTGSPPHRWPPRPLPASRATRRDQRSQYAQGRGHPPPAPPSASTPSLLLSSGPPACPRPW